MLVTVEQSCEWLSKNSANDCQTIVIVTELSLAWLFNSCWHNLSAVAGTILQQLLARFFNNQVIFFLCVLAEFFNSDVHCWRIVSVTVEQSCQWPSNNSASDCWTIVIATELSLARLFYSCWHDSSAVAGTILQQLLARFFNNQVNFFCVLAEFFVQCWRIVSRSHFGKSTQIRKINYW